MLKREYVAPTRKVLGVDEKLAALVRLDDQKAKRMNCVCDLTRGRTWNLLILDF
jgi:hypothetical protein